MYKSLDGHCAPGVQSLAMHLSDYMTEKNLSDEDVAAAIARSRVSVSRYRRRLIRPDWEAMEAIRKFSDGLVDFGDWRELAPGESCSGASQ